MIEAFNSIREKAKQPLHLLVVGFGTDGDRLKNQVYELGISSDVTFTDKVTDDEIVELHKVGDIFCMPSPSELQCIAALEAMASGKPVVAVEAGALPELCQDGKNGFLCEKDNVKQIAASLLRLVNDDRLRSDYGKQSVKIATTHDMAYTLDRFEEIYAALASSKTPELPQRLL